MNNNDNTNTAEKRKFDDIHFILVKFRDLVFWWQKNLPLKHKNTK